MKDYSIRKRVVKPSEDMNGRITKQHIVWDVITPKGAVVRSFKRQEQAKRDIQLRQERKSELLSARDEAFRTGQPITVCRRGRSPVTVSFT